MKPIIALPRLQIELDGAALPDADALALARLWVREGLSVPSLCELTFSDPPGLAETVAGMAGARLEARFGEGEQPLFSGEVTAVEWRLSTSNQRELRMRGYDRLHRLSKRQPVRTFVETTLEELARELTSNLGISVDSARSSPLWRRLVQHSQSDLELLRETALRSGHYFFIEGDTLKLMTLEGSGETVELVRGESLLEARLELNSQAACRSVTALGWDPWRVELFTGESGPARSGRRIGAQAPASAAGGDDRRTLVNRMAQTGPQIEAMAQAELDLRTAAEAVIEGTAEGNARLHPGVGIEVEGVGDPLNGRYVVTQVEHHVDRDRGFVSCFSSVPPKFDLPRRGHFFALGVVLSINDPEGLGRIKASLPSFNDIETDWLAVLSAGAGAGKGLVTLPDVGDRVLLVLDGDDPAQGIVIGGLYGADGPPDHGIDQGAVKRFTFLTPGGQRVRLDDGRRTLRLENSDGSFFEMGPEKVVLHCETALEIEAPGSSVIFRGDRIDFQRLE